MSTISGLSLPEVEYFQTLSSEKLNTVKICFKNLFNQLELNSDDAKETLCQLHENYQNWDETEKGKEAWSPLLDSLQKYLQNDIDSTQELVGRIQALQECLPSF